MYSVKTDLPGAENAVISGASSTRLTIHYGVVVK